MKSIEGWRRMDNKRGYMNITTGQNIVVVKKEFGERHFVMLFPTMKDHDEGRRMSPEYTAESRAKAFASDWMIKHPRGAD